MRATIKELRDERAALLAREERVTHMVDVADREYRAERKRFESALAETRDEVKALRAKAAS